MKDLARGFYIADIVAIIGKLRETGNGIKVIWLALIILIAKLSYLINIFGIIICI